MSAYIAIHFEKVKLWLLKPWRELPAKQKGWTALLVSLWLIAAFIHVQLWYVARHFGVWTDSLWYELLW
ncbi:MAG TPA: acyltransferase, partial [Paenibacillus sp.]|nr:acyltransferase [Paenibacillus sp.]